MLYSLQADLSICISFDNRYAWIFEWDEEKEKIVTVRAYLDSALINKVMQ